MVVFKQDNLIEEKQLEQLYKSVYWTSYTDDLQQLVKAVSQSLVVITAWHDSTLVGLIRGVGDGETILYIQDLLVHPDFQNRGIGKSLINKVFDKYAHVRQKVLLAEETKDLIEFYQKCGLKPCNQGDIVAFYREF